MYWINVFIFECKLFLFGSCAKHWVVSDVSLSSMAFANLRHLPSWLNLYHSPGASYGRWEAFFFSNNIVSGFFQLFHWDCNWKLCEHMINYLSELQVPRIQSYCPCIMSARVWENTWLSFAVAWLAFSFFCGKSCTQWSRPSLLLVCVLLCLEGSFSDLYSLLC